MKALPVMVRAARVCLGSAWGGLLVIAGLWMLRSGLAAASREGAMLVWGGGAMISAGEYVFLCVVADRLCPMKDRRLGDALQIVTAGTFAVCVLGFLVAWQGGL